MKYTIQKKLKVTDICCGMSPLVDPWYQDDHDVTLIELNEKLIPFLKVKYPLANIINDDFLTMDISLDNYDVILCNPPFNTEIKKVYIHIFLQNINTIINLFNTIFYLS